MAAHPNDAGRVTREGAWETDTGRQVGRARSRHFDLSTAWIELARYGGQLGMLDSWARRLTSAPPADSAW